MKIIYSLIIGITLPLTSLANVDDIDILLKHHIGGLALRHMAHACNAERLSMIALKNETYINRYKECTKIKKFELAEIVLNANNYLSKQKYLSSKASLRSYFNSMNELLSIPPISPYDDKYEISRHEAIASGLLRRIESEWSGFIMDLKEEGQQPQ